MRKKYANKGFTLMEMIVVIVIIGILMAILVPGIVRYVSKAKAAACQVNKRELLHELYYEYGLGNLVTEEDMQKYAHDSDIKCTDGNEYTVTLTENGGVPEITLGCIHSGDEGKSADWKSQGLYKDFVEFVNSSTSKTNDELRREFYKKNGNKWPKIEIEGEELNIQPFLAEKSQSAWLYATSKSDGEPGYMVSYVYDPKKGIWYRHLNYNGDATNPREIASWRKYTTEEEIRKILEENTYGKNNHREWVEVTDFKELE